MSNSQTNFDAHMALVIDYGIKAAEYARASTGTFKLMCGKDAAYAAVEASARALAAPEHPNELAAQARACAESLRLVSQTRRVQEACDALEQCARALAAIPAGWEPATGMTAGRAAYFMRRFKHEEKLLGPNEQAAVDFVLDMLASAPTPPTAPAQDAQGVEDEEINSPFNACMFRDKCRSMAAALRASSPAERPPYCGSGHCSCIECHFPATKERA